MVRPPAAQGRITLASPDPTERPNIDYNYLSDPTDLPRLRDGVRKLLAIGNSKEMQAVIGILRQGSRTAVLLPRSSSGP